jgi:hypothetical protein
MLNTDRAASGEMIGTVRDHVTQMIRELGFAPRGWAKAYHKPYPECFDIVTYPRGFRVSEVPYPIGFRVPDFIKFTRGGGLTLELHMST